jgi:hypothetical protein
MAKTLDEMTDRLANGKLEGVPAIDDATTRSNHSENHPETRKEPL